MRAQNVTLKTAAQANAKTPRANHSHSSAAAFGGGSHSLADDPAAGVDTVEAKRDSQETARLCGNDTGLTSREFRYWSTTISFLVLSYIIALSVNNLGVVLALVGATGSTMVSYILPGFCYFFIFDQNSAYPWKRYVAFAQGVAGCCIIPICLTFIFIH
jgi:hypothetical protein